MTSLTLRAGGTAPVDVAWARYAVPARWPSWSPQIRRVEASAPRIAAGVSGRVRGPVGVMVDFEVLTVDEQARTWSWRVRLGPIRLHLRHAVTARIDGSATELRVDGPLPVVVGYAPLAQWALFRLCRG